MSRLYIVSNRVSLPKKNGDRTAGGLEVALRDTLKRHSGTWLGWSGTVAATENVEVRTVTNDNLTCIVTDLSREDYDEYYKGFANSVLWPILHYRLDLAEFSRRDLSGYMRVNRRLATVLSKLLQPDDVVWVHDYHLIPFARILRELGHKNRIGFFLHVPMPPPEILTALPNYELLLPALREYDLIGFQTRGDAANFARFMAQECGTPNHISMKGETQRLMRIGTFPVGIDAEAYRAQAERSMETSYVKEVISSLSNTLIIGVDRLDYSKGIPHRLDAFEKFLTTQPQWRGNVTYIQITPKTRSQIPGYAEMEHQLELSSGRINFDFGDARWTPIRYVSRTHSRQELAGLYRHARVGLVTPMRDGMNLVAKEYIAAQDPENPGVLVLSKFAGAAEELHGALLVNPYDIEAMATAIATALNMPLAERIERYRQQYEAIEKNNINQWADRFLDKLKQTPASAEARPRASAASSLTAMGFSNMTSPVAMATWRS